MFDVDCPSATGKGVWLIKGKLFLFLFGLPFFAVGVWMTYAIGSDVYDTSRMDSWTAVRATLTDAGVRSHRGDDSTTYEAYAAYTYVFDGREFRGDRVGLSGGADNIGSFQEDAGRRLQAAMRANEPISVFVNPANPAESIIHRELRWAMIGFRSIFVFVFGGVGLGLIIVAIRSKAAPDPEEPRFADSPWLANDDWQAATLRSSSKATMYVTWGFAAFWNLVSAPLPFIAVREITEKQNYAALLALLFPAVGVGLLVWAWRRTSEWKRFGPTPVTLDPFPGSIGGHVGGTIDLAMPYKAGVQVRATLTNLRSYISGSGKNRSRRESALWQDRQVAHLAPGGAGTRITFRFDVPSSAKEADAIRSNDTYHLWRLNIAAELPGVDLDRDFDIPVYATASQSQHISSRVAESAVAENRVLDEQAAGKRFDVRHTGMGKELVYPMGRNGMAAFAATVIGGLFAGVGVFLFVTEGERFLGGVFAGLGGLVVLGALYAALNSLSVRSENGRLHTVRRILGVPVSRRSVRADQIQRISSKSSMQSQSGNQHVMHFSIFAHDNEGRKIRLGEGFNGESETQAAIRLIQRELSIRPRELDSGRREPETYDALAADS